MEKEFIPYKEALALKELGFDEPCFAYYQKSSVIGNNTILPINFRDKTSNFNDYEYSKLGVPFYSAPTFSQSFRWFREKHDLFISIDHHENRYSINDLKSLRRFNNYEEAELACLNKLIEIIKTK
jgi:hypothetical protein